MAHMVPPVLKRLVFLITLLIIGTNSIAQLHTTMVCKYENQKNNQRVNLSTFLARLPKINFGQDCLFASGSFKFKISSKRMIDSIEVTGDLPDTVVRAIKTRILESTKYWIPVQGNNGFELEKSIVIPVFIDRSIRYNCKQDKHLQESERLILSLFDNKTSMINTETSYLLTPICFFGSN